MMENPIEMDDVGPKIHTATHAAKHPRTKRQIQILRVMETGVGIVTSSARPTASGIIWEWVSSLVQTRNTQIAGKWMFIPPIIWKIMEKHHF